jgi:hypothetical protein
MNYKANLLFERSIEDQLIHVNIDDLGNKRVAKSKNNVSRAFSEVIETVDLNDIVRQFIGMKTYLSEHGFMETMEMHELTSIIKDNFIEYDTFDDNSGEDNNYDDYGGGYDMMPLEEKCLYEK